MLLKDMLSSSQAARRLGLSTSRVQQLCRTGKLRYTSTPIGRLIDPSDVDRLIEERRQNEAQRQQRRKAFTDYASAFPKRQFSSQYRGVTKHACGKWVAQLRRGGKQLYIGLFADEEEAARAYDKHVYTCYNDLTLLNFPDEVTENGLETVCSSARTNDE